MAFSLHHDHILVRYWPIWLSKLAWGIFWATWGALVPAVQQRLELTDAELGKQLVMVIAGVLPATFIGGRMLARLGRVQLPLTLLVYAAGTYLLGQAQNATGLGMALLICGAASGMLEVTLTCMISMAQIASGKKLFSYGQAIFPLAVVITAPLIGLLKQAGVDASLVFSGVSAFLAVMAVLTWIGAHDFPMHLARRVPDKSGTNLPEMSTPLMVLALLGFILYILEHSINHWSVLFLQRDLGASPFLASWGPSIYMGAAFIGRLAVHRLGDSVADLRVVAVGFVAGSATLFWVGMAANPWFALAGYLVAGLMMSPAIPAIYSLASRFSPQESRIAMLSNLSTICNIGYLVSPLVFGTLSSANGMLFSWRVMGTLGVLCLVIMLIAHATGILREGATPEAPGTTSRVSSEQP